MLDNRRIAFPILSSHANDYNNNKPVGNSGSGGEVHHPTVLRSVNLSQPSGQLHQRRVRDKVSDRVRVRARVRNRVRDRHRLSVKQLGGELLHQRRQLVRSLLTLPIRLQ